MHTYPTLWIHLDSTFSWFVNLTLFTKFVFAHGFLKTGLGVAGLASVVGRLSLVV